MTLAHRRRPPPPRHHIRRGSPLPSPPLPSPPLPSQLQLLVAMAGLVDRWIRHAGAPNASPVEREVFRQRCGVARGSLAEVVNAAKNRCYGLKGLAGKENVIARCLKILEACEVGMQMWRVG